VHYGIILSNSPWRPSGGDHSYSTSGKNLPKYYRNRKNNFLPVFLCLNAGGDIVARLAIFIDGGYLTKLAEQEYATWIDYGRFSEEVRAAIGSKTLEPLDLVRTYYYDCLPYQSTPPTQDESRRYGARRSFFVALQRLPKYAIREGRLMYRGLDRSGQPIFEQKRVDLLLGLDFALLAGKHQISHAAVVSGDSDLIPAVEIAQQEGIVLWLVHGPRFSKIDSHSTYAEELWDKADERLELTKEFITKVVRTNR
jgi:uncharacterized LabA/DUF88 family protein